MGKHGKKNPCGACGGKGYVVVNLDSREQKINCDACEGTGEG